jgi:hypothetical protein
MVLQQPTTTPNNTPNNSQNNIQNKKLYTSQEIQAERKSQFENDLTRKQNEFTRAMSVPVPEIPKFSEDLDKPIGSAMDELIAKTLAERNYEIQQIQQHMPPPQTLNSSQEQSQQQSQQQFKYIKIGEEVKGSVMTPIDVNDVFGRTPEKNTGVVKNVSWGENEYQEYNHTQQPSYETGFNDLFSKLKKVEPNTQEQQDIQDLKMSVNKIQKQMTTIHEKIEILLNRIK